MRKFLSLLLTMAMVLSLAVTVNAAAPKEDITILHTNDVHCDYEKYAKVATLHKSADLLVDAGDHVQGGVIGTLSKGEYIVDIMNYLKYDAAVPGNTSPQTSPARTARLTSTLIRCSRSRA